MIGYRSKHSPRFWVEKELYWNPKVTFRQKTNSEFADDIERFIEGYNVSGLYLDPSAESFQVELRRRKIRVIEAVNDVFPGITFVANLISNHQLKVVDTCKHLVGEMEMYVWDSKKALRGIEEPVKSNDHLCDALRYALYTAFGSKMKMDLTTPSEIEHKQIENLKDHGFYGVNFKRWD
jgi:phage terminase large subunit